MSAIETTSTDAGNSKANVNPPQKPVPRNFRLIDLSVILFCITGAAFSLNLFRLDLFQSIALQNKKPMGSVTVKLNNVQRRFSDRVLWSRLAVESPVYLGDLIRVADYSAATLRISDDVIDLNENTLIRIRASADGEGRVIIDMGSGSLSISGGVDGGGGIALNVMGRMVAPQAGTTLSASAGEGGMTLQVNEGSVTITEEDGRSRSLVTGGNLTLDTGGVEQAEPSAVVTLPRPNARFIKNSADPLNVRFAWNAANIDQQQPLRLEIASGPNFKRIARTIEGVNAADAALGAGTWHWRLSYQNAVLSAGQFTIADAAVSAIASPIKGSLFRYRDNLPAVRFEWKPVENASYYILQIDHLPDSQNPLITRQTAAASFVEQIPEAGTWHWRVKPVFSSLYEGSADFSPPGSFRVEQIDASALAAAGKLSVTLVLPESSSEPAVVTKNLPGSNADNPPSALLPEAKTPPPAMPESSNGFISSTAGWKTMYQKSSMSTISIGKEIIDGMERDVLTINATLSREDSNWAGTALGQGYLFHNAWSRSNMEYNETAATDTALIQKLINANGVRFKVLGDGKRWRIYFLTSDVKDNAFHGITISTQNGEVSSHDISYSRLNQPDSRERAVRFNRNNIKEIVIEKSNNTGNFGTSTIKIFDFEVY